MCCEHCGLSESLVIEVEEELRAKVAEYERRERGWRWLLREAEKGCDPDRISFIEYSESDRIDMAVEAAAGEEVDG